MTPAAIAAIGHASQPLLQFAYPPPPPTVATAYVELERGQWVGFVVQGARVQRVIEARDRSTATEKAQERADAINRRSNRNRSRA